MTTRIRSGRRARRQRSTLAGVLFFGLACLLVLVLVEGASSLWHFAESLRRHSHRSLAERSHTRYDAELGWVGIPALHLPDFYGAGRSLTTNARGFRGPREVEVQVPAGRLRIVCSGDSFTLGYGVGDDDTWCAQLAARDPRFETVNMGQGGYGIGQAFLWYARDGAPLEHHVHVFAFITADFARLVSDRFQGYGKPRLRVRDGELAVENVPVPRAGYALPWLARRGEILDELRSVQLLRRLLRRLRPPPAIDASRGDLTRVASRVLDELQRLNREKGSTLVLVYLPMRPERHGALDERLPRFVRNAARQRGIVHVDLLEELRALPEAEASGLYLKRREEDPRGAEDHLSVAGNAWVAERLHAHIARIPAVQARIAR
jgi:hypothetical protein